jgi:Sortase domain
VTPARSRTTLVALLVTLAVTSGAAGLRLLAADPEAAASDVGKVPGAGAPRYPASGEPRYPASGALHPGEVAPRPPVGERSRMRRGTPPVVHSPGGRRVQPAAPRRLLVDSAGLRAPVVPVGAGADGELAIPGDPGTVGWWVGSAPAGDRRGSTVLAGHVDSAGAGLGALSALGSLPPGTRIVLVDVFGARHPYRLAARRTYPKRALPPEVLRRRAGPRLVLVTCGGPFDEVRRSYRDNLVVYAVPA